MESNSLRKIYFNARTKQQHLLQEVRKLCTVLVPVLKDHNLNALAEQLGSKLFELDALEQEVQNAVLANPEAAFEMLLESLEAQSKNK